MIANVGQFLSDISDPVIKDPVVVALLAARVGYGNTLEYVLISADGTKWEAGTGTLGVGGTFTRATVTSASDGGAAKIVFPVGRHQLLLFEPVASGALSFSSATVDFGSTPVSSGNFTVSGSGWTVGNSVLVLHAAGPLDELDGDRATAYGVVETSTQLRIYWHAQSGLVGSQTFKYQVA
jgi:hypothetical protein